MRLVLIATLAATTLNAAAIRGVILDHQTGRPLARATVVAQPIAGTAGVPRTVRSAADGSFELSELAGGAWLVTGSRRGFAPTRAVANADAPGLTIRMRRFGAISGTVLDENDVGLQEHDVVAYRNARPLSIVARAKTDDRGVYRLEGLEPGTYVVRTVGREYWEGSYLSTFAREALLFQEAQTVTVRYDDEIALVDLRPPPGRLMTVSGTVFGQTPATVTLISDVGTQFATVGTGGVFRFPPVVPGRYEAYVAGRTEADWQRFELYEGSGRLRLTLAPFPELRLSIEDTEGKPIDPLSAPILIRRRDLTGEGKPEPFRGESRVLAPGRWELSLAPTPSWYSVSPSGWTEVALTAPGPAVAKFVLSNRPATIRGVVRDLSREPVAGALVQLDGLRTVRTDSRGQFEFYGLGPGAYRLIATFDPPPSGGASATAVSLEEGQDRSIDLALNLAQMTRALLLALIAATASRAAVVRGTVVENFTGKLLSGAVVALEAMPGTPGGVRTFRTSRLGSFEFGNLAAGAYVLKASRRGFLPIEHGQKRWNSAGRPLVLEEATTSYITLRLPRFSAVTGTVVDENEIGLPGQEVAVYKASQPPEYIRDAPADDRGVYRVGGLTPGKYFVRTVGKQYEEGSYLPTFSRESVRPEEAQLVEVFPEQETARIDIRPLPGRLSTLAVGVTPEEPDTVITLASVLGRKRVQGNSARFSGLSPGEYEVYAECSSGAAYQRFSLSGDMTLGLLWGDANGVAVTGGPPDGGKLRLRRKDLAGAGPEVAIPASGGSIPAGRWEVLLETPDGYYVSGTTPPFRGRLDGWIEYTTRPRQVFGFRLSGGAATLQGVVKDAPYAPVYLEAYDGRSRQRAGDLKAIRADAQGQFRFANLAPGAWRLLSTYEYLMPDSEVFDSAAAPSVTVTPGGSAAKDLELWVIR